MSQDELIHSIGRHLLASDGPPLPPHVQAGLAVAVVAVVAIAGVMSGLTLGLLSMNQLDLELMLRTGSKQQERLARRLSPIISQPHWVLSTLVICNTAAGMALPLCLDRLVNVAVALVLSTTAIVLFGEILPQAVCSRYGLSIGGHAAPVVRLLMWLTAPVSWPIGKALDALLGHEQPTFGKRQISALVDLHRESAGMGGPLNEEEAHVILGVLDLSSKTGSKAMTPLDKVFMLSTDDVLDRPTLKRILDSGHSRVPVYRAGNRPDIIGLILVKELLAVVGLSEPGTGPVRVKDLRIRDLPTLPVETPMTDLLNLFQTGHSHMALLLQKQDATGTRKDALAPATITTVASCSSSSEGGSTPTSARQHPSAPRSGSTSPAGGVPGRVASLLRSLSGKTLGRSNSKRERGEAVATYEPQHTTLAVCAAGLQAGEGQGAASSSSSPSGMPTTPTDAASLDLMETGALTVDSAHQPPPLLLTTAPHESTPSSGSNSRGPLHPPSACAGPALMPHVASAPGTLAHHQAETLGAPPASPAPGKVAAGAAAAGCAAVLGKASPGGLARPSAAAVWKEAGWDAAGGVPVGVITLEDVLEELMQEEIVDETDAFIDNEKTCRVNARVLAMSLPPGVRRLLLTSQQLQAQRLFNHQESLLQQQQQAQQQGQQLPHASSSPLVAVGSSPGAPASGIVGVLGAAVRTSFSGGAAAAAGGSSGAGAGAGGGSRPGQKASASAGGGAGGVSKRSPQAVWPGMVG